MQLQAPPSWVPGPDPARPAPTTFDEASMERSKSFVKALQELKNLRPQLYSAAEYCEKSYLHSEQKHIVLDNLKDYAVRALVNAVDHLGTVAYKLTDLYEQQVSEVSTVELKVASLNQQVLTCQTYTDKEGLRQQQMIGNATRHHKHYIVPTAGNKRMQAFSEMQTDAEFDLKPKPYPSEKTLFWHLASEKNTKTNGEHQSELGHGETKTTKPTSSGGFNLTGSAWCKAFGIIQFSRQPKRASNPKGSRPHQKYASCFLCQAQVRKDEKRLCSLISCKPVVCSCPPHHEVHATNSVHISYMTICILYVSV
ncbi:probable protein ABIL1 isoform X1 [Aegilops tauschii subsp. strangulata]